MIEYKALKFRVMDIQLKTSNFFCKIALVLCVSVLALSSYGQATIIVGEETTVYGLNDDRISNCSWTSNNPSDLQIVSSSKSSCRVRGISPNPYASVKQSYTWNNGQSGSMDFTVSVYSDSPEDLKLSVKRLDIDEGVERTITVSPSPAKATNYTLTWTAVSYGGAPSDVVQILHQTKESCTFKAMKAGQAYVKATTDKGVYASCYVSVTGINPTEMFVEGYVDGASTMYVGNSRILETSFSPADHHSRVSWTSDNPDVVSVSSYDNYSARVNANAIGSATITATSANGLKATHVITVNDQPISLVRTVPERNEATKVPLDVIPTLEFSPNTVAVNPAYPGYDENNFCCLKASDGTIVARELIRTGSTFQLVPIRTLKPNTRYTITIPAGYLKIPSTGEISQQDFTLNFTTTTEGEGGLSGTMEIQGLIGSNTTAYAPAVVKVKNSSNTECTGYARAEFYNGGNLLYARTSNKTVIPAGQEFTAYFVPDLINKDARVDIVATFISDDGENMPIGKASVYYKNYMSGYDEITHEDTDYYDEGSNSYYTPLDSKTCYLKLNYSRSGNIVIPEEVNGHKVVGIGYKSFSTISKSNYFSVQLPSSIEWIAAHAFYYSWSLTKINLPAGLKYVGREAFYSSGISEIELPDGIEMVADEAFSNCSKLKTLKLPHNSFDVGNYLWFNCTALESVYTYNTDPPLFSIYNFYNGSDPTSTDRVLNSKITLYVPQWTKQIYAAKAGWSRFGDIDKIVEFDAGYTPSVLMTGVNPKDGAAGISVNVVPLVRFSSNVELATTLPGYDNDFITLKDENGNIVMTKYAVQVYDNIVQLTPVTSLQKGTRYTFTIGAGQIKRKDVDIVNTEDITFSFTTMEGEPAKPLELLSSNPVDGATNVSLDIHPQMKFSSNAITYRLTPYGNILLKKTDGTEVPHGPLCTSGELVWVEPDNPLEPNTTYIFTIGSGVFIDPATVSPCSEEFSISFTTGSSSGISKLSTEKSPADIYDLHGRKIRTKATSTDGLPKGLYVTNGKKIVVR